MKYFKTYKQIQSVTVAHVYFQYVIIISYLLVVCHTRNQGSSIYDIDLVCAEYLWENLGSAIYWTNMTVNTQNSCLALIYAMACHFVSVKPLSKPRSMEPFRANALFYSTLFSITLMTCSKAIKLNQ